MMGVWNARLLDDSLHKALYGRGKALYQSTHHYKDFGLLVDCYCTSCDEYSADQPLQPERPPAEPDVSTDDVVPTSRLF